MMLLLEAMGHEEGYFARGLTADRPQRNNNPLDLTYCAETIHFGATSGDPRFAVFPDVATGWQAGARWLSVPARFDTQGNLVGGYLGARLAQVLARFAPPNENNTSAYAAYVYAQTGFTAGTVLTADMLAIPAGE